jgi:hypothetical protein
VPAERFESFWALVAAALTPRGRVFFCDDGYRTPEELIEGAESSVIQRRTPDGAAYRIVKVPHEPADLEWRLRELGWDIAVTPTAGPFFWGAGNRAGAPG